MRLFYYFLCFVMFAEVAKGDAVIFSGNDVKALKQNLDLFGVAKVMSGSLDPSAGGGVAAPQGSIYLSTAFGLWEKTGGAATAWTKVQLKPVNLASATDVTGVLGIVNGGTNLSTTPTNGQLLIGDGVDYTLATLTGTANQVNITNGAGSITLSLPQDIATSSDPSFNSVTVTDTDFGTINVGQTFARGASTGVLTGGILTIDADPTKFDLSATTIVIVDNTDPLNPTRQSATCGPFNAQTVTNIGTQAVTHILLDASCNIIQQFDYPTPEDRRQYAFVGRLNHSNLTTITFTNSIPDLIFSPIAQEYDLFDALGPFNITGNTVTANGANLQFNKSSGFIFQRSANYTTTNQNPHVNTTAGTTPTTFRYATQTATPGGDVTTIDPTNYDVGGTVTAVPNPVQTATVQRIYLFSSNNVRVLYGQATYSNLAAAIQGFASETFVVNPTVEGFAVLIGFIAIQKNCTSLQDTTCSRIMLAPKFAQNAGGGGSGAGTTTLQQAYLNSVQPQITLNSTQLGIQIADAATPIGSDLFEVMNNAGTTEYLKVASTGIHTTNFTGTGTAGAVRFHNLTTTERDALTPAAGMEIYNTTTTQFECYVTSWLPCSNRTENSDLTLTASDTIAIVTTLQNQTWRVQGNAAAISLSTTPFGTTNPLPGTRITLIGNHATNTVSLTFNDAADGYVGPNITLGLYDSITVEYNSTLDRYVLVSRSN